MTGLVQELRCHLQVALCRFDIDMAKIGGQVWQQPLDVLSRAIPRDHAVNRRRMPQVMQTRRLGLTGRTDYGRSYSAWGPDADLHTKVLIHLAVRGAMLDAYTHCLCQQGFFWHEKAAAGVSTATASPRECTQRPPEGHLGRVIAFR